MNIDFNDATPLLTISRICSRLGISRSTLARLKGFPKPDFVLGDIKRWDVSTLDTWSRGAK